MIDRDKWSLIHDFHTRKLVRVLDDFNEAVAILHVTFEVADAGLEDVLETASLEEVLRENPSDSGEPKFLLQPQGPQVGDRVDRPLACLQFWCKLFVFNILANKEFIHQTLITLDERDDRLAEVLRDVLGLVPGQQFIGLVNLLLFLSLCVFPAWSFFTFHHSLEIDMLEKLLGKLGFQTAFQKRKEREGNV